MLIRDFLDDDYYPIRLVGRSPRTKTLYTRSVVLFDQTMGRPSLLDDLTDHNIARHIGRLLDAEYSRASAAKERFQLMAIARFAFQRGILKLCPYVPAVIIPHRIPKAWLMDDLKALVAACREERLPVCGVPGAAWWTSLHLVLWDSGERIGALKQVRWTDLDGEFLTVRAETRKRGTRDAFYRLSPPTVEWLDRARKPKRDLVWPWRCGVGNLYYHYSRIIRRAGLPKEEKNKFHRMRRSVASYMKAAGVDPQYQLLHQNARTTLNYLDPRIVAERCARDVLEPLDKGPPELE